MIDVFIENYRDGTTTATANNSKLEIKTNDVKEEKTLTEKTNHT